MKKTKNNLSKIDKSKRQKNRSTQSSGDRETERRPLEKNTCFVVGMRRCGRREARGEMQNTVNLLVGEVKKKMGFHSDSMGEVKQKKLFG